MYWVHQESGANQWETPRIGETPSNQPISELDIFSKHQALSRAVVVNSNMSRGKYLAREGPGSRLLHCIFSLLNTRPWGCVAKVVGEPLINTETFSLTVLRLSPEYSLRNTGTVELPACSSSLYLSSFIPSSCLLWNSLPPDVSSSSSVSSFTLMLDSHFSFDRFTLGLS